MTLKAIENRPNSNLGRVWVIQQIRVSVCISYTFYQVLPSAYVTANVPFQDYSGATPSFTSVFEPIPFGDPERDIYATATNLISQLANITFTQTTNANADIGIAVLNYAMVSVGAWVSPGNSNAQGAS